MSLRPAVMAVAVVGLLAAVLPACAKDDSSAKSNTTSTAPTRAVPKETVTVFRGGEDDTDTFRLPAVVTTTKGTLLAFAEARTVSPLDHDPHGIVVRRSVDGGTKWGAITGVAPYDEATKCSTSGASPVSVTRGEHAGDVVVVYLSCLEGVAMPGVVRSSDDGRTWSKPATVEVATADGRVPTTRVVPGPGHAIELQHGSHAGRLVVAAWGELAGVRSTYLLLSDDGGRSWRIGASAAQTGGDRNVDESIVTEAADGMLLLSSRNPADARTQARSADGGETFTPGADGNVLEVHKDLVNPGVQGSLLTVGDHVIFSSPSDPTYRRGLRLWRSADLGATWQEGPLVVPGVAAYSDLVALDDDTIGVLVETGDRQPYERIDLVPVAMRRFDETPAPLPDGFDPATAIAGRVVVDKARFAVESLCMTTGGVAKVGLDGGDLEANIAKGLSDVAVTGRLTYPGPGGKPLTLDGNVALDLTAGISFRGTLNGSDGATHQVDFVAVNTIDSMLLPSADC